MLNIANSQYLLHVYILISQYIVIKPIYSKSSRTCNIYSCHGYMKLCSPHMENLEYYRYNEWHCIYEYGPAEIIFNEYNFIYPKYI